MARIRTIKPDFFKNEELADLPAMTRLLFIGLWTQADREGRLEDRPKRLKAEVFPYDNYDVDKGLNELQKAGFIIRYKINANGSARILVPEQPGTELALIQIMTFSKHQKIDKMNEKPSQLPPIDYNKTIDILPIEGERKGKEGEMEGKESYTRDVVFENFVLKFFGFNEIAHFQQLKIISECCAAQFFAGRMEFFIKQCHYYAEYIAMIGSRYKHSFPKFIGNQSEKFADGVWQEENWEQKIQERQSGSLINQKSADRGPQAVVERFTNLKMR